MNLTIEQIESIVFSPVGEYSYKLKYIKIIHPQQNISGLIRIQNNYFEKIYA